MHDIKFEYGILSSLEERPADGSADHGEDVVGAVQDGQARRAVGHGRHVGDVAVHGEVVHDEGAAKLVDELEVEELREWANSFRPIKIALHYSRPTSNGSSTRKA